MSCVGREVRLLQKRGISSRVFAFPSGPPSGIHTMKRETGARTFSEKSGHTTADYAPFAFYKGKGGWHSVISYLRLTLPHGKDQRPFLYQRFQASFGFKRWKQGFSSAWVFSLADDFLSQCLAPRHFLEKFQTCSFRLTIFLTYFIYHLVRYRSSLYSPFGRQKEKQ